MLTKNNFTTEAIVAKYVTAVKNLAKERGVLSEVYQLAVNELESYCPHQQLIANLWFDHEGCPTDHPFLSVLSVYKNFFNRSYITEEEYSFLLDNYQETIEYLFSERQVWTSYVAVHGDTPKELAELTAEILSLEEGKSIFLPFCGYGDLAIKFPQCKIIGVVEHQDVAALTQIRLDAAGISAKIDVHRDSEELQYILPVESVDAIFCNAYDDFYNYLCPTLSEMYDMLSCDGKMVAICSNIPLTSKDSEYADFRTKIYKQRTIRTIIQLPAKIHKEITKSSFLLCIDKTHSVNKRESIVMFNASFASSPYRANSYLRRVDIDALKSTIKNAYMPEDRNVICRIAYEKVDPNLLIPGYYLLDRKLVSNRCLTDLVDYVSGSLDVPEGKQYSYTFKGQLVSDFKSAKLSLDRIDKSALPPFNLEDIYICHTAEPCIFLAITGDNIMLRYSEVSDCDAFYRINMGVTCLKPKEGVSVDYVAALLLSQEVKEQITAITAGYTIRKQSQHLLSKVLVPEHTKQEMSEYLGLALKASMTQQEQEMRLEREAYERNVRLRKHALTQSVSSFDAMFKTLNKCRIRQGGVLHDEDKISPVSNKTVSEVFEILSERMSSILKKLAHIADVDIDFGEPEDIDPEDFILQYIKSKKSTWLNFVGVPSWDSRFSRNKWREEIRSHKDNRIIAAVGSTIDSFSFPKAALEHVFNNIVANAIAHGFTDENRSDYKVRFSWEVQGLDIVISIENNGNPLSDGVKSTDILSYGYSTKLNIDGHNGLGGSEIASIMKEFNGDVEVQSYPEEEYPVKYILCFHNTNVL